MAFTFDCCDLFTLCLSLMKNNYESALVDQILNKSTHSVWNVQGRIADVSPVKHLLRRGARRNGCIHGLDKDMYYPIYYRLYSLSVFLLAKSLCTANFGNRRNLQTNQLSATVEPRYNDPRYNDIPGITINMLCPGKSYCKMYGTEPRYNDLRYKNIPDITMSFQRTERQIFPDITILQFQYTDTI